MPLSQTEFEGVRTTFKKEIWGPGNLEFKNVSVSSNLDINCTLSKFFNGNGIFSGNTLPDACIRINPNIFSKFSKPWNCQVHIVLYPTIYHMDIFSEFWPSPFSVLESNKLYSYSCSASTPKFHIVNSRRRAAEMHPYIFRQWIFEILFPKGLANLSKRDISKFRIQDIVHKAIDCRRRAVYL